MSVLKTLLSSYSSRFERKLRKNDTNESHDDEMLIMKLNYKKVNQKHIHNLFETSCQGKSIFSIFNHFSMLCSTVQALLVNEVVDEFTVLRILKLEKTFWLSLVEFVKQWIRNKHLRPTQRS